MYAFYFLRNPEPGTNGPGGGAIRDGAWKLIEWYETGRTVLYNLREVVSESLDCAGTHPDIAASLLEQLRAWRIATRARMPVVNPWYDDILAGRLPWPDGSGIFPENADLPPGLSEL